LPVRRIFAARRAPDAFDVEARTARRLCAPKGLRPPVDNLTKLVKGAAAEEERDARSL
jgi:hypothetical protein